jgi:hypothetical protein
VLVTAGVDKAIAQLVGRFDLSPLVWPGHRGVIAPGSGLFYRERGDHRGIMAPIAATMRTPTGDDRRVDRGGSLIASHVATAAWLVKYFNLAMRDARDMDVLGAVFRDRAGGRPAARADGGLTC